jgi:hypothetical protein
MVPRGARRSDQQAQLVSLMPVRGFLPSWSCEFDSRHPLHIIVPSQLTFQCAQIFEHQVTTMNRLVMRIP